MKKKQKILIVDDSKLNQQILAEVLGEQYAYLYADDGLQALEVLSANLDLSLILLDIHMPKMDGLGVLNVMKERQWVSEVPVIVISAEEDMTFIQKAYDLGATDYINRPINMTIVQRRVSNTILLYEQQHRLVHLVRDQVYEREKINSMMISILSNAIETRNHESGAHVLHVRVLTEILLRRLIRRTDRYQLSQTDISQITMLSALHDIGKIRIPEGILNKPGKLDPDEWEKMKQHTVFGDEILQQMADSQANPFIRTAREICRYHHERWDGKGYPDGLRGDEIPVSAQVVALADVFDALTSDRCYRRAIPFEDALKMIRDGACGEFNPLLIECMNDAEEELRACLQRENVSFDYQLEATQLASEALERRELPQDDRGRRLLAIEKAKTQFYAEQCGGIQFEYDHWLQKVVYTDWYADASQRVRALYPAQGEDVDLLTREDWLRLREQLNKSTTENPYVHMNVLIPVQGEYRWHRLSARTIWTRRGMDYAEAIGQFTDIHEEALRQGVHTLTEENPDTERLLNGLRGIFDVVRLVDAEKANVLEISPEGEIVETGARCYEMWNRCERCENCSSCEALACGSWVTKLEMKDADLYFVLSKYLKVKERPCVLEIASRIDDKLYSRGRAEMPEKAGVALLNFYRDALTHAYSRLYLNDFEPSLESADGVALLDVDRLKQINDEYGHHVGDEALQAIVAKVGACIRQTDTLIRYGGDEFLLIFNGIAEEVFFRRLEQIQNAVRGIVLPEYPQMQLGVSIGGAYRVKPLSMAIRLADQRMYENKARHRRVAAEEEKNDAL